MIPGGAARLRPGQTFFDVAAKILRLAADANGRGDYFPVYGVCLGFEAIGVALSGNTSLLSRWEGGGGGSGTGGGGGGQRWGSHARRPHAPPTPPNPSPRFDAEDTAAPLYFTEAAERSALFGGMARKVREDLAAKPYVRGGRGIKGGRACF